MTSLPTTIGPMPATSTPATPAPATTPPARALKPEWYAAYRMRLSGRPQAEVADHFGVDRTTIYRWEKAVEDEAIETLVKVPNLNLIVAECEGLRDLEQQARTGAENAKSDTARTKYLAEARRAAVARQNLLLQTGVLPRMAEQMWQSPEDMKPSDMFEDPNSIEHFDRAEAVTMLIEHMSRNIQLG